MYVVIVKIRRRQYIFYIFTGFIVLVPTAVIFLGWMDIRSACSHYKYNLLFQENNFGMTSITHPMFPSGRYDGLFAVDKESQRDVSLQYRSFSEKQFCAFDENDQWKQPILLVSINPNFY